MGCFNDTCAISGLPICYPEKVVAVVLASSEDKSDRCNFCYVTDEWRPIGFWFKGTYNDYGALENIEGDYLEEFMTVINYFTKGVVEVNWENFWDLNHEGELKTKSGKMMKTVYIKEGIFNDIMTNYKIYSWGSKIEWEDSIRIAFMEYKKTMKDLDEKFKEDKGFKFMFSREKMPHQLCQFNHILGGWNFVAKDMLSDEFEKGNETKFDAMVEHFIQFEKLSQFLDGIHKGWHPTFVRTQDSDTSPYKILISSMQKEMKKLEREEEEDEE